MKKLVCFGDSITAREISDDGTERLTPRLRNALSDWEVINSGVSGNNTRDALARLAQDVLTYCPDIVTVLLGANDAASHKMIQLSEYKSNMLTIVSKIGAQKTILITPSPVDENRPRNRTNEVLQRYSDVVENIAALTGSGFINLFSEMIQYPDYVLMLRDGLHFEESGYKFLSQLIIDKIKGYY
jgi:lysophospholipase L1-like esterase